MDDVGDGGRGGFKWREGNSGFVKGGADEGCWEGRLEKKGEGEEQEEEGGDEGFGVVHDEKLLDEKWKGNLVEHGKP